MDKVQCGIILAEAFVVIIAIIGVIYVFRRMMLCNKIKSCFSNMKRKEPKDVICKFDSQQDNIYEEIGERIYHCLEENAADV